MPSLRWPHVCKACVKQAGGRGRRMTTVLPPPEERVRARLELVSHLATRFAEIRDLVGLFRMLYEETSQLIDATVFLLSVYDATSETVQVVRQIDRGVEHD